MPKPNENERKDYEDKQKTPHPSPNMVPTDEELWESRRYVEEMFKERNKHPFTMADFELVLKAATRPLKREQAEKESEGT